MMTEEVYEAICGDDAPALRRLLGPAFRPQDWEGHHIWPRTSRRLTLLQLAVREGCLSVIELVISLGLALDYGDTGTALVTALEYEQLDSLQVLIRLGADINKRLCCGYGSCGQTLWNYPIVRAIRCSNPQLLELLLLQGAEPLALFPATDYCSNSFMVTSLTPALKKAHYDSRHLLFILQAIPSLEGCWTCWLPIPEPAWMELNCIYNKSIPTCSKGACIDSSVAKMMLDLGARRFPHSDSTDKSILDYVRTPQPLKQICRLYIRRNFQVFAYIIKNQHGNHSSQSSHYIHVGIKNDSDSGQIDTQLTHELEESNKNDSKSNRLPCTTYNEQHTDYQHSADNISNKTSDSEAGERNPHDHCCQWKRSPKSSQHLMTVMQVINALPLPRMLKDYLRFKEYTG